MILLDTDHLSILLMPESVQHHALNARILGSAGQSVAIPIVSAEEQLRGWLAFINRFRDLHEQIAGYERLIKLFQELAARVIVPFDARAADECDRLRKQKIRIGTQDLKIAAITLVNDALLLSANLRDFQKVPNLRVENWLE